jgi:hypothetical protein
MSLLLYEAYVWVSLGSAMKAKQSKAKQRMLRCAYFLQGSPQCPVGKGFRLGIPAAVSDYERDPGP